MIWIVVCMLRLNMVCSDWKLIFLSGCGNMMFVLLMMLLIWWCLLICVSVVVVCLILVRLYVSNLLGKLMFCVCCVRLMM